jgi:hypothetical protein
MVNLKREQRLDRSNFWTRGATLTIPPVERFGIQLLSPSARSL